MRTANIVQAGLFQLRRRRAHKRDKRKSSGRNFWFNHFVEDERDKLNIAAGGVHVFKGGDYVKWQRALAQQWRRFCPEVRQTYCGDHRLTSSSQRPNHPSMKEQLPERTLDERVTSVGLGMQSCQTPVALPEFSKLLSEATSTSALRTMADEVRAHADRELGQRSLSNFTVDPNNMKPFDKLVVSSRRKMDKACDERHPGICKSSPHCARTKKSRHSHVHFDS